jgi:hypothetical protein
LTAGVEEEFEEEEVEANGVWMVGNVEVESKIPTEWTKVTRKKKVKRVAEILNVEKGVGSVGCHMEFHVTEAKRMLAAVGRITAAGNVVRLGDNDGESYIENVKTKQRMYLRKERGVYVLDVLVMVNGQRRKCQMVVDSGAAENVMPREMLTELDLKPKLEGVKFVAANGEELGNYGRRSINFVPFARQA